MSPESVSVGEEWEGHSMLMDRKQKRRGNQHLGVWCEESGACYKPTVSVDVKQHFNNNLFILFATGSSCGSWLWLFAY